ncbi:hypothetical protein [Pedobacter alpinus]|uniref:Outer membrane protein beta-barrel domain-containing protein n=1 Tax=Pedobacter alpinus TaxID=1590643 RepID=A0ABW5TVJ3_9SPHI
MTQYLTKTITALLFFGLKYSYAQTADTVKHKWFIPTSAVLQHAGSIGYFSTGIGYKLNKRGKSTLDLLYGFVPAKFGGDLSLITAKFAWRPFKINVKDWAQIYPVNPGVFLSYHAGGDFDTKWDDDNYPDGYYWWSTALRPHISISTELKLDAKKLVPNLRIKYISLYSEFNTNELYGISYFLNPRDLNITGIFKLGIGTRVTF